MKRWVWIALVLVAGCNGDKGNSGDDSPTWPYSSATGSGTGSSTGTGSGAATGTGTGAATGAATGTGTGAGTGTGTGTGTGSGTGGATGTGTGAGTGSGTGGATGTGTGGTSANNCVESIPNNANVIDSTQGSTDSNQVFWICAHDVLSYTGNNSVFFVEDQAQVVINGTGNVVWSKSRGDTTLFDTNNTINCENCSRVDDQTSGPNTIIPCDTMTFDLTNAPNPGC